MQLKRAYIGGILLISLELLAVASAAAARAGKSAGGQCTIALPTDLPPTEPVYLQSFGKGYKLFTPNGKDNKLRAKTTLFLACTGKNNALNEIKKSATKLQCHSGDEFTDENGQKQILKNLNCTKFPDADLRPTTEKCSRDRGFVNQIGFPIDSSHFVTLFEICYDNSTQNTYYSHHTINGAAIKYNVKESQRRQFKATGMIGTTAAINRIYTKNNQVLAFKKIFGADQQYINNTMFLARGHLAPDADFVFSYAQLATYFYANVAPQFQAINAGNWLRVESLVRNLASDYNTDLQVYTGYRGVLELPKSNGERVKVYLDDAGRTEIPKWFFKVVKHEELDAAVVIISSNNPFADASEIEEFCPNVCEEAGLASPHWSNIEKGYTFCCELDAFTKVVDDLPADLTASKLLHAK